MSVLLSPQIYSKPDGIARFPFQIALRMAGWVRLSIQCLEYEYPSWHLLLSFNIFDLTTKIGGKRSHGFGDNFVQTSCERLAVAFRFSQAELQSQYNDHLAFAIAHFKKHEQEGFAAAWAASIKRPSGMRLGEQAALRQSVHAVQAWDGFTSSEVERGFSAICRLLGKHRDQLTDTSQSEIVKIAMDIKPSMYREVIQAARKLWLQHWGSERTAGTANRTNFRLSRKPADSKKDKITETAFLRRRRATVQTESRLHSEHNNATRASVLEAATAASTPTWSGEQQRAENKFKQQQATSLARAAMGDNVLVPAEKTDEVMETMRGQRLSRAKLDHEHDVTRRRVEGRLERRRYDVQGLPTYFSSELSAEAIASCKAKLRSAVHDIELGRRHEAVVFVVPDVAKPGYHIALAACINGGLIVNSTYFLTNSAAGVVVTYAPAGTSPRKVYLTPAFVARYPVLVQTFDKCIAETKWTRVHNAEEVLAYHEKDAAKVAKQRRPTAVLVLALTSEKSNGPLAEKRWALTLDPFLHLCRKLGCCTKGISGL